MASAAIAAMRREQAGDRIGPWQLERLLAEGGMGAVWVAQRADGVMQRTAALKLPRAEWVDHGLSQRLARERAILALTCSIRISRCCSTRDSPTVADPIWRSSTSTAYRSMPGARDASPPRRLGRKLSVRGGERGRDQGNGATRDDDEGEERQR